jgi:hypothetical protein
MKALSRHFPMLVAAALLVAVSVLANFSITPHARAASSSGEWNCQKSTWTPGALTTLTQASTTVVCPGAALGDFVDCAPAFATGALGLVTLSCSVSAANTVTLLVFNSSAGTLTPPAGAYNVRIWPFYKSP